MNNPQSAEQSEATGGVLSEAKTPVRVAEMDGEW